MLTRYDHLRAATGRLAAPHDEQRTYLNELFLPLAVDGDSSAYGCDELALQFEDYFISVEYMLAEGELSSEQADALNSLNDKLEALSGEQNADFWRRDALQSDARWADVRALARTAVQSLPPKTEQPSANL